MVFRWRKREKTPPEMAGNGRSESGSRPVIEVANLQGVGARSEQQDAFGMSPLPDYDEKGFLCVLCDGMGGMDAGREIAQVCVQRVLADISLPMEGTSLSGTDALLGAISGEIHAIHGGSGGATLVLTYIRRGMLQFCCMGDSDLFLVRDGSIYAINEHQTYENRRVRTSIGTGFSQDAIFGSEQADALVSFLGCVDPVIERSVRPIPLVQGDMLILCSDGVSNTCTQQELLRACTDGPEPAAAAIEEHLYEKQKPNQDNYTAIICKYNGGEVK